jgi:hypothetical protein
MKAIEIAQKATERAATLKDWRITNRRTIIGRDFARELLKNGGYFIGTQKEAAGRYPDFVKVASNPSDPFERFIWAFDTNIMRPHGRRNIDLVAISSFSQE